MPAPSYVIAGRASPAERKLLEALRRLEAVVISIARGDEASRNIRVDVILKLKANFEELLTYERAKNVRVD